MAGVLNSDELIKVIVLLFLVIDPFGNIPFILSLLKKFDHKRFRSIVLREIFFAYIILNIFLLEGDLIIRYLNLNESSISIAGGIVLFIISLKMIFKGSENIFEEKYGDDPILVPIAMPSIAGPSAIATCILIKSDKNLTTLNSLLGLTAVIGFTLLILIFARAVGKFLGNRGLIALDRLMGMVLIIISVNMMLNGISLFLTID